MKKVEAIDILESRAVCMECVISKYDCDACDEAFKMAISAIKLIGHLNNRPCEACEFHKENGCCKWNCVFDDLLYAEHKG